METVIMESEETSIMKSLHIEEKLKYLTTAHGTRYLFGILVLITIMVAVFRIQEKTSYGIAFNEDQIVISGPAGTDVIAADYQSIRSVTLLKSYEAGDMISGISQKGLYYGRYENNVYGEYFLCVIPSIQSSIEIRTDSEVIVFNYESEKVTAALSQALSDLVLEKQR